MQGPWTHRLYHRFVELSFYYRYLVPSERGRWQLLKMLRRYEPPSLSPGMVKRGDLPWFISDLRSNVEEAIYYGLPYDPETAEMIDASVKSGDYVIDVGANVGVFTSQLARRVGPSGRVFAFEPSPLFFQTVSRNIELQRLANVRLFNLALSDKESVAMHYTTRSSGSLVSAFTQFGMELRQASQVTTKRLDDVLSADEARRITFIKIDVDGNEVEVLRGSESVIRQSQPRILIEISERAQRLAGESAQSLIERIADLGYWFQVGHDKPSADVQQTLNRVINEPVFCDVLCIHGAKLDRSCAGL